MNRPLSDAWLDSEDATVLGLVSALRFYARSTKAFQARGFLSPRAGVRALLMAMSWVALAAALDESRTMPWEHLDDVGFGGSRERSIAHENRHSRERS